MTYKLAIIDDHPMVCEGLCDAFLDETDFEVVATGGSATDALRIVQEKTPDVIFLDVNMPGGGVTAAEQIRTVNSDVRILMFSFRQDAEIVKACLGAGASGYVVKGVSGPDLVEAARTIAKGETYVDPKLQTALSVAGRR